MMKMKLLDRLILRFGALLTLLTGAVSLAAGILLYGHDLGEGTVMRFLPVGLIAAGAVAVIISALNVLVARRYAARRRSFVTQHTELGELRIAVPAIENLIQKCVETHKEVKVQEMNIKNRRGAVDVEMRVSMNSNVSIPHAVEQLQSQIKRYLAASSGIDVRDISVAVERTMGDDLGFEPEPFTEAAEAEKQEAAAAEKEKIPMHQRIFGRDPEKTEAEQIAEAELIAAPSEEAAEAQVPAEEKPEAAEEAQLAPEDTQEDTTEEQHE